MDRAGIEKVDSIRLAGAFGSHIDPKYAMAFPHSVDKFPELFSAIEKSVPSK